MPVALRSAHAKLPFGRVLPVAVAGLVAFLALMEGVLAVAGYGACGLATRPNMALALTELGISAVAYVMFLLGAFRLKISRSGVRSGYVATVAALFVSGGIISSYFLLSTTCAR